MSPKRIELNRTLFNLDDQDDIEETGVKSLSFSQSLIHSAYDSAESTATPPDSDLEDAQLREMLRKMKDKHEHVTLNEKA